MRQLVHCLQSKDIKVGDTLMVENKEELSCDVVLLATSDPEGTAYIETGTRCAAPWLCSRLACCALLTTANRKSAKVHAAATFKSEV